MYEILVARGAMPVHLARWDVDDIARTYLVPLGLGGQDAPAFDAMQYLRNCVSVKVSAGTGAEPHEDDVDAIDRPNDGLHLSRPDEVLGTARHRRFGSNVMNSHWPITRNDCTRTTGR